MWRKVEVQWSQANEILLPWTVLQHDKNIKGKIALEGQKDCSYEMQMIYVKLKAVFH